MTVKLFSLIGTIQESPSQFNRCNHKEIKLKYEILELTRELFARAEANLQQEEPNSPPDFWMSRIVARFATLNNFHSINFFPVNTQSTHILFVQKNKEKPPFEEYWAPYLSEAQQKNFGCKPEAPIYYSLRSEIAFLQSVSDLAPSIQEELSILLGYFLRDRLYCQIGVTFDDPRLGKKTRFWTKT